MSEPRRLPPSTADIRAEQNEVRRRILLAMNRLLEGRPTIEKPGRLSVAALAREAQIDRARLTTGGARDLGDWFARIVATRTEPTTAMEVALTEKIEAMKGELDRLAAKHQRLLADRDRWKEMTEALARALNLADRELELAERRLNRHETEDSPTRLRGL